LRVQQLDVEQLLLAPRPPSLHVHSKPQPASLGQPISRGSPAVCGYRDVLRHLTEDLLDGTLVS
ncbi:MAG TPA: hypothetical protein VGS60_00965, partial [Actinomycetes bacterium]|nr:hypothetical protein [Actinomycetes bacterium]